MRPFLAAFTLTLLFFTGCSHYQLGTEGKLSFTRLFIAPVENKAALPQVTALFSTQIRDTFLRDGRVVLVNSSEEADATLTISINQLTRNVATSRSDDTGLARKFEVTIHSLCTLRDNRSNSTLVDKRPVSVTRELFTTPTPDAHESDQLQAEYNLMPQLAQALADRVAHTVLDVW
ncbi:MAG: LPS assembly lipoprotein LptE [Nibricoccus sp.]